MFIYWILLAFPTIGALAGLRNNLARGPVAFFFFASFWLLYNTISALRFNTGGDWYTYNIMVEQIRVESLEFALSYGDSAFSFMIWIFTRIGLGIYGINALCSMILSLGVIVVARRTPDPWMAIAASVPYLLIVVGFGYIRQGAAIGFILLAISAFTDKRNFLGIVFIVLSMLFHLAAIIVLPVIGFSVARKSAINLVGLAIIGIVMFAYVLLGSRLDTFQAGYIDRGYSSSGASIRLIMNMPPALMFIIFRRKFDIKSRESDIWLLMSIASIICMVAFYLSPSSTAVDRVALFFSIIQIFVFGHITRVMGGKGRISTILVLLAIVYNIVVQAVWLFYAANAQFWVPYHSIFERMQGV